MRVRVNGLLHDKPANNVPPVPFPQARQLPVQKRCFSMYPGFALPQTGKLPPGGLPSGGTAAELHTVLE
jgi:hypothetical protein